MLAISIIALVVSGLALVFTGWAAVSTWNQANAAIAQTDVQREQVAAAREQTELQRALAEEALQPYVWADIQPDMQQGTMMQIVVGNSGPTMAQNIRATFDPPLPAGKDHSDKIDEVQRVLAAGLRSLAPGRQLRWSLGAGFDILKSSEPQVRSIRVEADGPAGPVPVVEIEVDITQWRYARDAPDGSLHHVRGAIDGLTKVAGAIRETLGNISEVSELVMEAGALEDDQVQDLLTRRTTE